MPGIKRKDETSESTSSTKPYAKKVKTDSSTSSKHAGKSQSNGYAGKGNNYKNGTYTKPEPGPVTKETSAESHAKQRAIAKERKAAKPNADSIARAKKLWERLRIKSAVPKDERTTLVNELLDIVMGNISDFVFKHDSVRVVQCAVKYANMEQKKEIAMELKGQYTALAESKYAKFLVAKLLVEDKDIREMIVSEFYGHVRRLINHPEASWILDDTYRQVATPQQKGILLREWYGPEFAIFKDKNVEADKDAVTGDLTTILEASPEKRKTIMNYLFQLINQLVQKKLTGFTMLHDAMLQYSLASGNTAEGISTEFLDLLKPTEEGDEDLIKNLAFTPSGSRLVCRMLALTTAKDRKHILRAYKDVVPTLARDPNGVRVLIGACEAVDDTVLTSKLIFPPLLPATTTSTEETYNNLEALVLDPIGRIALLYAFTAAAPSPKGTSNNTTWLIPPTSPHNAIITELRDLRTTTSKKDPSIRRQELRTSLLKQSSHALIALITARATSLISLPSGCQFMTEVLLSAPSLLAADEAGISSTRSAMAALADLAAGDPSADSHVAQSPQAGKMLKTLALGARYGDEGAPPNAEFAALLWERIEEFATEWAAGSSSFVVANLLENGALEGRQEIKRALGGKEARRRLEEAEGKRNKGAGMCLAALDG